MRTKILIVDDHKIVRDGLRLLIEKEGGFEVVGEACDGRTAVRKAKELKPHIILMDIAMPDLNGIEATQRIIADQPKVKIIALTMHSDRRFVMNMLKAGASGYLLKESAFEELVVAMKTVTSGKTYLCPAVANVVVEDAMCRPTQQVNCTIAELTPREQKVLQLLAEGKTTKRIASELNVGVKTIEEHRRMLMGKLDIHSVAELTKLAVREGLTSLE